MSEDLVSELAIAPPVAPARDVACCGNCAFVHMTEGGALPYCRRNPPTPVVVRVTWDKENVRVLSNVQLAVQPVVRVHDWCGEFTMRQDG